MPEPATLTLVGTSLIAMGVRYVQRKYREAKPWFDRTMAFILLIAFGPILLLSALLVKLTSRGPALYSQERVGEGGRLFRIIKLRTMRVDAETSSGPVWAEQDDPRTTPVGRFLRKTHLDEVPQLVNVLRGEMSLVGPRPERPHFVEQLSQSVPEYRKRLAVKPGITGLAQVRSGSDRDVEDVRRKVKLDIQYIQRMCWWADFVLIFKTLRKFAGRT